MTVCIEFSGHVCFHLGIKLVEFMKVLYFCCAKVFDPVNIFKL